MGVGRDKGGGNLGQKKEEQGKIHKSATKDKTFFQNHAKKPESDNDSGESINKIHFW